jgi:hypothetical protein
MKKESKRAKNKWDKARISYDYAKKYLAKKEETEKYSLSIIDLILISNFKGGSASICEPIDSAQKRLLQYSEKLKEIAKRFGTANLSNLSKESLEKLAEMAFSFILMTKEVETEIDGFGPSYASALLNIYFPELLPIIDRRVLNGAEIEGVKLDSQKQVINIERHYKDYITYCHNWLQQSSHSLETLDRELFSAELQDRFKRKTRTK